MTKDNENIINSIDWDQIRAEHEAEHDPALDFDDEDAKEREAGEDRELDGSIDPSTGDILETFERPEFNLDNLPKIVKDMVQEVAAYSYVPEPAIALSAMSYASVCAQNLCWVDRDGKQISPISLYSVILNPSGGRKSAGDALIATAVKEHLLSVAQSMETERNKAITEHDIWKSKRRRAVLGIERAKEGTGVEGYAADLRTLDMNEPKVPKVKSLFTEVVTKEGLPDRLVKVWPSAGVFSAEGMTVLGGHGMSKENFTGSLGNYNKLWSGEPIDYYTKSEGETKVHGAALTFHIQIQPGPFRQFVAKEGCLPRTSGLLARCLVCQVEPDFGKRILVDVGGSLPATDALTDKLIEILNIRSELGPSGMLVKKLLPISREAPSGGGVSGFEAWEVTFNKFERMLAAGGPFEDIRDWASKAAEQVARVAALFHILEKGFSEFNDGIDGPTILRAASFVEYFMWQAVEIFVDAAQTVEEDDADKLKTFLAKKVEETGTHAFTRRWIQQNVLPKALRKTPALEAALDRLTADNFLIREIEGKKTVVHVLAKTKPKRKKDAAA